MHTTGTHFSYYLICHRKLWLFANGITMENTSDLVYAGKMLHETSYPRRSDRYREIELDGIKIDYYDPVTKVVHEIKKSGKHGDAHEWQLKYYLFILDKNGIDGASGLLEYPGLHKTREVFLADPDRHEIKRMSEDIDRIIREISCPGKLKKSRCRNCSYLDFCWSGEDDF